MTPRFYSFDATPTELAEPAEGLELPYPVLHPALRRACVEALGWSRPDLDALLDDPDCTLWVDAADPTTLRRDGGPLDARYGIRAVAAALDSVKPELLLRRLPTPPSAERLAPWLRILTTARQHERYLAMDAPEGMLTASAHPLQESLDALVRLPAPPAGSRWVIDETPRAEPRLADEAGWRERQAVLEPILEDHHALLWIDDERICVTDPRGTRIVSADEGAVAELEVQRGLVPLGCDGAHVVFFDPAHPPACDRDGHDGIAVQVLALSTLRFVDSIPSGLPLVVLEHGEPEDAMLVDVRTGWTLPLEPQDRTYHRAFSRGLDVVWVGDFVQEIFDVRAGTRLWRGRDRDLLYDAPPPVRLDANGAIVEDPEDSEPADAGRAAAVHRGPDGLLHAWASVGKIGAPVFGFAFEPLALAFSADGTQIAALTPEGVSVFETTAPSFLRRVSI